MTEVLNLSNVEIDVLRKKIKNMYLSVHPPEGEVRISVPERMNLETIRMFAIAKLPWIKKQRQKIQAQARETPREYLNRESHYFWGDRYLLQVITADKPPQVSLDHKTLLLQVRPHTSQEKKSAIVDQWYREQLKAAIPPLIEKWQPLMEVKVNKFFVQRMKTKWGSCNITLSNIRLNTELAKKPRPCLEYVIVHEMTHLLEASHNKNFVALMDVFLPKWRHYQEILNRLPLSSFD